VETYGEDNFTISMISALLMIAVMVLFGKLIEKNTPELN
jgi:hypothetical protein